MIAESTRPARAGAMRDELMRLPGVGPSIAADLRSLGVRSIRSIGPVSSPASICMIVTPVSASPASSARWIGAAPRQRGRIEAWTLMQP